MTSPRPDADRVRERIAEAEDRVAELDEQRAAVARQLGELRRQLGEAASSSAGPPVPSEAQSPRSKEEKVSLFRSLFAGRVDVFPRLWRNAKTKGQGYAPACANEWAQGLCEKPKVKCGQCPHQAFVEVSDQAVLGHLQGVTSWERYRGEAGEKVADGVEHGLATQIRIAGVRGVGNRLDQTPEPSWVHPSTSHEPLSVQQVLAEPPHHLRQELRIRVVVIEVDASHAFDESVPFRAACERRDEVLRPGELDVQAESLLDALNVPKDLLAVGTEIGVDGSGAPSGQKISTEAARST